MGEVLITLGGTLVGTVAGTRWATAANRASAEARRRCALLAAAVLLIASCTTVPKDYPRAESTAFQLHESTSIGKDLAELAAQHPGESGVAIIRRGRPAFTARVVLADLAHPDVACGFIN